MTLTLPMLRELLNSLPSQTPRAAEVPKLLEGGYLRRLKVPDRGDVALPLEVTPKAWAELARLEKMIGGGG